MGHTLGPPSAWTNPFPPLVWSIGLDLTPRRHKDMVVGWPPSWSAYFLGGSPMSSTPSFFLVLFAVS